MSSSAALDRSQYTFMTGSSSFGQATMTMDRTPRLFVTPLVSFTLTITLGLLLPGPCGGQEFRVGVVQNWPGDDLLGSPLGLSFSAGFQVRERVGVHLRYEASQDRFRTFASTCFGMLPHDQVSGCAPETIRETADFQAVSLSVPLSVLSWKRLDLALVPSLRWAWFESRRTGMVTGRELDGDEDMWALALGAEAVVRPMLSLPAFVFLGLHGGFLGQSEYVAVMDGFSPFDEGFSLVQIELGVGIGR